MQGRNVKMQRSSNTTRNRLARIAWLGDGAVERHRRRKAGRGRRAGNYLIFDEPTIRAGARTRGPRQSIAWLWLLALCNEARLRFGRRIDFRRQHNDEACAAYSAMQLGEFESINACQAWSNWRTIPRNLSGRLPNRPVFAIDLCCGVGNSTEVLAFYCAPGSRVLGLEFNPQFVAAARRRDYGNRDGRPGHVEFRAQSVLERFCDARGVELADASVDLINASGAIGCHFSRDELAALARECGRVLRPGGLALIDSQRRQDTAETVREIFAGEGMHPVQQARSCLFDRYIQLCLSKPGE